MSDSFPQQKETCHHHDCQNLRHQIKAQIIAFKTLTKFAPSLDSEMLITNIRKIVGDIDLTNFDKNDDEKDVQNRFDPGQRCNDLPQTVPETFREEPSGDENDHLNGSHSHMDWDQCEQTEAKEPKKREKIKPSQTDVKKMGKKSPRLPLKTKVIAKTVRKEDIKPVIETEPGQGSSSLSSTEKRPYRNTNVLPITAKSSLSLAKLQAAKRMTRKINKFSYQCLVCQRNFTAPRTAWLHVRRIHFMDRISCHRCQGRFYDYKSLNLHLENCDGILRGASAEITRSGHITVRNPFKNFDLEKTLGAQVSVERFTMDQMWSLARFSKVKMGATNLDFEGSGSNNNDFGIKLNNKVCGSTFNEVPGSICFADKVSNLEVQEVPKSTLTETDVGASNLNEDSVSIFLNDLMMEPSSSSIIKENPEIIWTEVMDVESLDTNLAQQKGREGGTSSSSSSSWVMGQSELSNNQPPPIEIVIKSAAT